MWSLALTTFRKKRNLLLINTTIAVFFLFIYAAIFPSFRDDSAELSSIFDSVPDAVNEIFPLEEEFFSNYELFLGVEYYSISWPILVIIIVASLASSAIAGEISSGTISTSLAQPISRVEFYISKYMSGLGTITSFVLISTLSAIIVALPFDIEIDYSAHIYIFILALLFSVSIYSIGFMISSFSSSPGTVSAFLAGIFIVMYVLTIISSLQDSLDFVKYFSFFHYFDYENALQNSSFDLLNISVFICFSILSFLIGIVYFKRRDIA